MKASMRLVWDYESTTINILDSEDTINKPYVEIILLEIVESFR